MESWKNGRRDLFDQLTKVCDRIGLDLAAGALTRLYRTRVVLTLSGAEIDDRNVVPVGEEELRLLRETSARVGRLVERNAFLEDEQDKWKEASSRVEELQKENKRLMGELEVCKAELARREAERKEVEWRHGEVVEGLKSELRERIDML